MSGAHVKWTPELRAKRSAMMRAKWADPAYREHQQRVLTAVCRSPKQREHSRRTMNAWHERRRTDPDADATWRAAIWSANGRPKKRALLSEQMKVLHQRPDMKEHIKTLAWRTRHKRLNAPHMRKKRGGAVPDRLEGTYRQLIRKGLRAREAYLAIKPLIDRIAA